MDDYNKKMEEYNQKMEEIKNGNQPECTLTSLRIFSDAKCSSEIAVPPEDMYKKVGEINGKIMLNWCMPSEDTPGVLDRAVCVQGNMLDYQHYSDKSCQIPDKQFVMESGDCVPSPFPIPGLSQTYVIADVRSTQDFRHHEDTSKQYPPVACKAHSVDFFSDPEC